MSNTRLGIRIEFKSFVMCSFFACILFPSFSLLAHQNIEVFPQTGHSGGIYRLIFGPDGKYVFSSGDGAVIQWDISTGMQIRLFNGTNCIGITSDGKYLWSFVLERDENTKNKIVVYDINTGEEKRTYKSNNPDFYPPIVISPDGTKFLSNGKQGTIILWDAASGEAIRTFKGHAALCLSFSSDGKYALSGGDDKLVKLWDLESGSVVREFRGHCGAVSTASFTADGKHVLSAASSISQRSPNDSRPNCKEGIKLWDVASGKEVRAFDSRVGDFSLSALCTLDGRYILGVDYDFVRLWDIATGKELRKFKDPDSPWPVATIAISPDGRFALSYNSFDTPVHYNANKYFNLWDIQTGQRIKKLGADGGYSFPKALAISADGKHILSGHEGGTIKLWDIYAGACVRTFKADILPGAQISSLAFSPDGKYFVASAYEVYTGLWEIATGKEIRRLEDLNVNHGKSVFSPDGKYILLGGSGGNVVELTFPAWCTKP